MKAKLNQNLPFCGAWLAESEKHVALDLRVLSSSSMLGVEITFKKVIKKKKEKKIGNQQGEHCF